MKEPYCCPDWKPNIDKIDGFITLAAVRSGNLNIYDGKLFDYCPWCGRKVEHEPQASHTILQPTP